MTEREEFEAWAKSQHFGTEKTYKGSRNYLSGWTHFCWLAWQAARQQVVPIALPEPVNVGEMGEYAQAMRRGFDSCLRELKRLNPSLFEAAPQAEHKLNPFGWFTEDHETDKSATTYSAEVAEVAERWRAKGWSVTALFTSTHISDVSVLVEALKFYAQGNHYYLADEDDWGTVSGEPLNFQHHNGGDGESVGLVEDGSVAIRALHGFDSTSIRPPTPDVSVLVGALEDIVSIYESGESFRHVPMYELAITALAAHKGAR